MSKKRRSFRRALARAFGTIVAARIFLSVVVLALIVVHGLFPKSFDVDAITLGLLAILLIVLLIPILSSAHFPGGGGLVFRLDKLAKESGEAAEAEEAKLEFAPAEPMPSTEDAAEHHPDGQGVHDDGAARPPTSDGIVDEILDDASRSPTIGLIRLSVELERAVSELLLSAGWTLPSLRPGLQAGVERLVEVGVLTRSAASALTIFRDVRNEVIHGGRKYSEAEIIRAIDAAIPLLRAVLAIPRESNFVFAPGISLFRDEHLSERIADATGVMLKTRSGGGVETSYRIFPTTRVDYEAGRQVAWEWGPRQWGPAWYQDPTTGQVKQGWSGSMEFVGRMFPADTSNVSG